MKEIDPLEKQLQSWVPRRPSPKIQARLFGSDRRPSVIGSHVWHWLTPAVACALTLLLALTSASHHALDLDPATSSAVASVMYDPQDSNTPRTFILSRMDLNVDLNFWPHPYHPIIIDSHFAPATNHSSNSVDL